MPCTHPEFLANVQVNRVSKVENGPVVAYDVTATVKCTKCGTPFRWLGLQAGLSYAGPMVDVSGFELRAPIAPRDVETDTTLVGYSVKMRGAH